MKMYNFLLVSSFLGCAVMVSSCDKPESDKGSLQPQEFKQVVTQGQKAAGTLMKSLKKELFTAMGKEGATGAIEICRSRAMQITDSLAIANPLIKDIRRTSKKYRNPANAPDELDAKILTDYENRVAKGDTLPEFIVENFEDNGVVYHRYYQPLYVQPLCTSCHGQKVKMKEEIVTLLAKNYPDDLAYGYEPKEFRGLIRVTLNPITSSGD